MSFLSTEVLVQSICVDVTQMSLPGKRCISVHSGGEVLFLKLDRDPGIRLANSAS